MKKEFICKIIKSVEVLFSEEHNFALPENIKRKLEQSTNLQVSMLIKLLGYEISEGYYIRKDEKIEVNTLENYIKEEINYLSQVIRSKEDLNQDELIERIAKEYVDGTSSLEFDEKIMNILDNCK